jgi:hypothetical protein
MSDKPTWPEIRAEVENLKAEQHRVLSLVTDREAKVPAYEGLRALVTTVQEPLMVLFLTCGVKVNVGAIGAESESFLQFIGELPQQYERWRADRRKSN